MGPKFRLVSLQESHMKTQREEDAKTHREEGQVKIGRDQSECHKECRELLAATRSWVKARKDSFSRALRKSMTLPTP